MMYLIYQTRWNAFSFESSLIYFTGKNPPKLLDEFYFYTVYVPKKELSIYEDWLERNKIPNYNKGQRNGYVRLETNA